MSIFSFGTLYIYQSQKCYNHSIFFSFTVAEHLIEQTRDHLKIFEKKIKDKLKRNPDVVLEITDNFIECGLLDIDQVEHILHSPKKAPQLLVDFVIANIQLGTYNRLLETLKPDERFKGLVSDLTAGDDIKTGTLYYYN